MKWMGGIERAAMTLLLAAAVAPAARCEQGLLTFVFGPSSQETAKQGARAAESAARQWLRTAGHVVEIRHAGSSDAERLDAHLNSKKLEQVFTDAALAARDSEPPAFLVSLDAATQAAGLYAGVRMVAAVLNTPPLSSDEEYTLQHLVDVCRDHAVRVVVLDIERDAKGQPKNALADLATKTGGLWLSEAKDLESSILVAAAAANEPAPAAPIPAEPTRAAAAAPRTPGGIPPFEIPVHVRFIRLSGRGYVSSGVASEYGTGMDNANLSDETYQANETVQPMQGLLTVETPLNGLKFDKDDRTGTYEGRARVTVLVRNGKGAVVWSQRKDVNIHGPLRKLDARLKGSLFYLHGVTLGARGSYTLEAKVEDLVSGFSGVIRTPLRTSHDASGLVASDALAVRPFKGSADHYEADQVFSYEGEALAPVLNPVFRAEDPVDLRLYLVLYPDIHSAPPELSVEIQRDGRVVARMPLQFSSPMANTSMEGKFGTMQGYGLSGAAMVGGQSKEFPYLADLKGAKFSPGDYQAVISIRQGNRVITRTVAFRVVGKAPLQVARAGAKAAAAEDEYANVVLPEIEPVSVDMSGLKLPHAEQQRLWDEAAKSAMSYLSRLPNFRCTQETHRFAAPVKAASQLKETDSFKDDLMYEDGKETYRTVEINGVKADGAALSKQGVHSRNEFGSMLRGLFDPDTAATYKWTGRAMAMGVLCEVFDVQVAKPRTNFVMRYRGRREPAAYTGRVFIDADTGMVRRLTIQGEGLPKDFPLQSPAFSLDYGMVRIGDTDYLLPLRSLLQLREGKTFVRNETVFRDYRRFEAESDIQFQKN